MRRPAVDDDEASRARATTSGRGLLKVRARHTAAASSLSAKRSRLSATTWTRDPICQVVTAGVLAVVHVEGHAAGRSLTAGVAGRALVTLVAGVTGWAFVTLIALGAEGNGDLVVDTGLTCDRNAKGACGLADAACNGGFSGEDARTGSDDEAAGGDSGEEHQEAS